MAIHRRKETTWVLKASQTDLLAGGALAWGLRPWAWSLGPGEPRGLGAWGLGLGPGAWSLVLGVLGACSGLWPEAGRSLGISLGDWGLSLGLVGLRRDAWAWGVGGSEWLSFMVIRLRKEVSRRENCCFGALSHHHLCKRRRGKSRGGGPGAQNGLEL